MWAEVVPRELTPRVFFASSNYCRFAARAGERLIDRIHGRGHRRRSVKPIVYAALRNVVCDSSVISTFFRLYFFISTILFPLCFPFLYLPLLRLLFPSPPTFPYYSFCLFLPFFFFNFSFPSTSSPPSLPFSFYLCFFSFHFYSLLLVFTSIFLHFFILCLFYSRQFDISLPFSWIF